MRGGQMFGEISIFWRSLSDKHPIVALSLFIISPLLLAPFIVLPIYYLSDTIMQITSTRAAALDYFRSARADFLAYSNFVLSQWRYVGAYTLISFVIYYFSSGSVLLRDAVIFLTGVCLAMVFVRFNKIPFYINSIANIIAAYIVFLLGAIAPFLTEIEGCGVVGFSRWYSYLFLLFPVASGGLFLTSKKSCDQLDPIK
jgi:hypothetical protein